MFMVYIDILPLIRTCLMLIPATGSVLFYLFIIYKTSRLAIIDDIFLIHWEMKRHAWMLLLLLIGFAVDMVLESYIGEGMLSAVFDPIDVLILYYMSYVSTFGIYKLKDYDADDGDRAKQIKISIGSHSSDKIESQHNNVSVNLETILQKEESLHLFMIHLSKEYSMECLLSLIEITQYQQYALEQMPDPGGSDDCGLIRFPNNIPISSIIADKESDFKVKAQEIYRKYIQIGSEYEINISWQKRAEFSNLFEDEEFFMKNTGIKIKDINELFNIITAEMIQLLRCQIFM